MSVNFTVYYEKNFNDLVFIKNNIKSRLASALHPNNQSKSDPHELFCLSWITCFHKVSQKILLTKGYVNKDVRINLLSSLHKNEQGSYFKFILKFGISHLSLEESQVILDLAHSMCPISKLINQYPHLKMVIVNYDDIVLN